MQQFINTNLKIGSLTLANRLIQGPLAGFSCAPFRELFYQFKAPAYTVTEMLSAHEVVHKQPVNSRYLYRSAKEKILCYQISGSDPLLMAEAARRLESLGADLIDINCGCPKEKIRKKGAGSALLEKPLLLAAIIATVRQAVDIPLTIKIRIQGSDVDLELAKIIEEAGADALIVHGRRWTDDYDVPSDYSQIAKIKAHLSIPIIANGDIAEEQSLQDAFSKTGCDAYMISRAGTGKPWLYQSLLESKEFFGDVQRQLALFLQHLQGLASLENEFKAVLQSRSLLRYYFRHQLDSTLLQDLYKLERLGDIEHRLRTVYCKE
ncbi:MAG: tRNA-dihydrouridine synthase family protein [Tatlockia sp.]|nr:tRNA-dihydrouridine synthase family protein [Tatlockia sp.]